MLQTTLGNTGKAVDNTLPLNLGTTLGGVGQALDPTVKPVVDTVVGLTQQVGATTGLGKPVDGTVKQVGGLVEGLGTTVKGTGLPGGLSAGVGGLVEGLGKTVASTGGLLNADPKNPQPLTTVLGNATNAVGALTAGLSGPGGLLNPVNQLVGGVTGGVLGGPSKPLLEPALGNVGKTVDNVLPLGLQPTLGGIGKALDPTASPLAGTVVGLTQQVGATTKLGAPVAGLLNTLGGTVSNLGTQLPGGNVAGLNGVLQGLGGAVSSAGGLLNATPGNPNPLGATLANATGAVASLTSGLGLGGAVGGNNGGLLSPITGILGGVTGGAAGGNGGLLAPVTGLLGGV
ncbi:PE-PGRS family protein, partial [Achromobacter insuavis AXX-A]